MFIATNRFKVKHGSEAAFETVWRERDTYIAAVPGFVAFDLCRGPEKEEYTLYISHTVWATKADFEAWTKSDAFRLAHRKAGESTNTVNYIGGPEFEGFESVLSLTPGEKAA
ncbi:MULTISPECIES: antibiotic biosynthesis monooxygenase [unclassified Xanthobacter]|uniref:antibiotic biosynthesis monooxygenase family protein n=1 Tax=Xanthobacter TaxID=279 RepID=UPI001F18F17F|nr:MULTISPECIES: antibiotic biosynthesis monooxygenase [unclassified Xanthobacter]